MMNLNPSISNGNCSNLTTTHQIQLHELRQEAPCTLVILWFWFPFLYLCLWNNNNSLIPKFRDWLFFCSFLVSRTPSYYIEESHMGVVPKILIRGFECRSPWISWGLKNYIANPLGLRLIINPHGELYIFFWSFP